jgi:hypothetical protein
LTAGGPAAAASSRWAAPTACIPASESKSWPLGAPWRAAPCRLLLWQRVRYCAMKPRATEYGSFRLDPGGHRPST